MEQVPCDSAVLSTRGALPTATDPCSRRAPGRPALPPRPNDPLLSSSTIPSDYSLPAWVGEDFGLETDWKRDFPRQEGRKSKSRERVGETEGSRGSRGDTTQGWTRLESRVPATLCRGRIRGKEKRSREGILVRR